MRVDWDKVYTHLCFVVIPPDLHSTHPFDLQWSIIIYKFSLWLSHCVLWSYDINISRVIWLIKDRGFFEYQHSEGLCSLAFYFLWGLECLAHFCSQYYNVYFLCFWGEYLWKCVMQQCNKGCKLNQQHRTGWANCHVRRLMETNALRRWQDMTNNCQTFIWWQEVSKRDK